MVLALRGRSVVVLVCIGILLGELKQEREEKEKTERKDKRKPRIEKKAFDRLKFDRLKDNDSRGSSKMEEN